MPSRKRVTGQRSPRRRVAIVGCGYLGQRVATMLGEVGCQIVVLTRSAERAESFRLRGWEAIECDLGRRVLDAPLAVDSIVFAMGNDRKEEDDRNEGVAAGELWLTAVGHLHDSLMRDPERFVYISTTGVYRGGLGSMVDESAACEPVRSGARAHYEVERCLSSGDWADRLAILRVGGLYGPDRLPRVAQVESGEPIAADPEHWLNLIHVDDAARVVSAAVLQWPVPTLAIVTDGSPVRRVDFYREVARCLGAPEPIFASVKREGAGRSGARRTIRSRDFDERIRPHLRFHDYREGLRAIFELPR